MTNHFYFDRNGQNQGPIDDQQLQTLPTQVPNGRRWLEVIVGVVLLLLLGVSWMSDSSRLVAAEKVATKFTAAEQAKIDAFCAKYGTADVKAVVNESGATLLHRAARFEDIVVLKFLVFKGADVNARDNTGDTPLHLAVLNPNIEVAKFLVFQGADVNAKEIGGLTPLYLAVALNLNIEVAKFFVAQGADVNVKNNAGRNPLHVAAHMNTNVELAKFLVSHGANIKAKDNKGETPLDIAREVENTAVVEYLSSLANFEETQKAEPIDLANVELFDLDKLVSSCKKSEETLAKNLAAISSYEREIAQLRDDLRKKENLKKSDPPKQPIKRSDWLTLKMGEFEEEAVFKKRVELAKQKSETDYSKAMEDWKANVKLHNDQWESYVKTLPTLRKSTMEKIEAIEKKIAIERKTSDSIQTKVMIFFPYTCTQLPTFDRTTMSFPSVTLFPCGNEWGMSPANEYCRFSFTGDANKTQSLYFPTLEKAKAFKESYERNEVVFWVVVEVQYIESKYEKVITQTAQYETVMASKVPDVLLYAAIGALI